MRWTAEMITAKEDHGSALAFGRELHLDAGHGRSRPPA